MEPSLVQDPPAALALEPPLDENARKVLAARYLLRDETGRTVETPRQLFWRVARGVGAAEAAWGRDPLEAARELYPWLARLEFLPNSPTLMNAARPAVGQLAACFVLPVDDTIDAIFKTLGDTARIQRTGGGTGFAFSRLRPRGDVVRTTGGRASGPVSFLRVFNAATDAIHQGGVRRGANMGILRVDHPDVLEFVDVKSDPRELKNFNLSVAVTDAFMAAVTHDDEYELVNPRTGQPAGRLRAREVFQRIAQRAWESGEPGLIFIDRVNAVNPTPELGEMESTNPCVPADTWVLTQEGPRQVADLLGAPIDVIVDGEAHPAEGGFFCTGQRMVHEVSTREGYRFAATEDHRVLCVTRLDRYRRETEWRRVAELRPGDLLALNDHRQLVGWLGEGSEEEGFLLGLVLGDGSVSRESAVIEVWGSSLGSTALRAAAERAAHTLPHRRDFKGFQAPKRGSGSTRLKTAALTELAARYGMSFRNKTPGAAVEQASSAFQRGFLRGLFDADGSVQGEQSHGVSVRLAQSNREVLELVQRMLLRFGIVSSIHLERRPAGERALPDGKGGMALYPVRAQHELVIANDNLAWFADRIGFAELDKDLKLRSALASYKRTPNRERFVATVSQVRPRGVEPVYDIQVPGKNAFDGNGCVLHNCGESPLLPYESCNLGSIDVGKLVHADDRDLDWERLRSLVHTAVRFLDDVIEVNRHPLPEIEAITRQNRKVGLGIMGFADLLLALGVRYDSQAALDLARRLGAFVQAEAVAASRALAVERGPFPEWPRSIYARRGEPPRRNATVTTIAPTGTIALIAGCSSGIEPLFALAYVRRALDGEALLPVVHPALERVARARGFWSPALAEQVARTGTLAGVTGVPEDVRQVFRTALEIAPEWHVRLQAAFQSSVENAVSKSINLPRQATLEDVRRAFLLAYELGCKGITVYRDGSRELQVLSVPSPAAAAAAPAIAPLELEGAEEPNGRPACGIEGCG